jgi:hypothetical protein
MTVAEINIFTVSMTNPLFVDGRYGFQAWRRVKGIVVHVLT